MFSISFSLNHWMLGSYGFHKIFNQTIALYDFLVSPDPGGIGAKSGRIPGGFRADSGRIPGLGKSARMITGC